MSIKRMLCSIVGLLVVGMVVLMFSTQHLVQKIEGAIETSKQVVNIEVNMLMLRKNEKDFMSRKDISYRDKFQNNVEKLHTKIDLLEQMLVEADIPNSNLSSLTSAFDKYDNEFHKLVSIQQEIGLNEEGGAYGSLRVAAHTIQSITQEKNNKPLEMQLLLLRGYEKDFMLRLDENYAIQFNHQLTKMAADVDSTNNENIDLASSLNVYRDAFNLFVSLSKQKGLTENEGIIGALRRAVKQSESLLFEEVEVLKGKIAVVQKEIKLTLISLSLGIILVIALLVIFIATKIANRLKIVIVTMNDIAEGEGDLRVKLDTSGNDEIAELGRAFNVFVSKIHHTVSTVAKSTEQLASTSEEMSVVMDQAQTGVYKQQQDISQISASIEEMNVTVQDITLNSTQAEAAAVQARHDVSQGCEASDLSINNVTELAKDVGGTTNIIKKLVTHSNDIGGVLTVIQEIAAQTNLLALNAAIEAARAGESGRGFAVVADEVRTLAMRTQDATKEISTITDSIQVDAQSATKVMANNEKQANNTVHQATLAHDALMHITQSVEVVTDMNNQISVATEQQSQTSNEISHHMADINQVCVESATGMEQLSVANKELVQMTLQLKQLISKFKL
ncbi:methyl-accepting chemotaxis protein [Vibrio sp. F74]|uniref:methyl-accepting chemotaxis protein n=1 Tax=Vibrio sp. F74 TaxID=700020 RepID=UPI0035F58966